jgi:transposase
LKRFVRSVSSSIAKINYGSRSLRGTHVAAVFYTLCETAKLAGIDPHVYLLRAFYASITQPGTVIYPEAPAMPSNPRV